MGVSGTLATMSPAELLQWLSLGHKTGTLIVTRGTSEKKLTFQNGLIVVSGSNDPRHYLGQYLMRHGYITQDEHEKGMELQAQLGMSLGRILVMIEAITEAELLALLTHKAEEEVAEIFGWHDGQFMFIHEEIMDMEMISLDLDPARLMFEASRLHDERFRVDSDVDDETERGVGASGEG